MSIKNCHSRTRIVQYCIAAFAVHAGISQSAYGAEITPVVRADMNALIYSPIVVLLIDALVLLSHNRRLSIGAKLAFVASSLIAILAAQIGITACLRWIIIPLYDNPLAFMQHSSAIALSAIVVWVLIVMSMRYGVSRCIKPRDGNIPPRLWWSWGGIAWIAFITVLYIHAGAKHSLSEMLHTMPQANVDAAIKNIKIIKVNRNSVEMWQGGRSEKLRDSVSSASGLRWGDANGECAVIAKDIGGDYGYLVLPDINTSRLNKMQYEHDGERLPFYAGDGWLLTSYPPRGMTMSKIVSGKRSGGDAALDMPLIATALCFTDVLYTRSHTVLDNQLVVCSIGDRVVIIDVVKRQAATLCRGRHPLVVEHGNALPKYSDGIFIAQ